MMVLGVTVAVVGCSTPMTTREKGAVAGGAIGAGTGAIIGSQTGHPGTGALIGAGIGALSGAIIGDAIQGAEQKQAAPAPAPPPAAPPAAVIPAPAPGVVAPPPPPPIVVSAPPQLVVVPGTPVYYAPGLNANFFYYGGRYYAFDNDAWFVASAYNGPWAFIAAQYVPQPVLAVPVQYYKVPPGHWKKHGPPPWAGPKKWKDDD